MRLIKSLTVTAIALASVVAAAPSISFAELPPPNTRMPINPQLNQAVSISAKVKLTSFTLKETNIPWMNPVSINFSLHSSKPVHKCRLEYEIHTNDAGKPPVQLAPPLDFLPGFNFDVSLPLQAQQFVIGTLEINNIPINSGPFRFTVRAKNTPTNTCVGEVHTDFVFLPKP